MMRMLIKKCDCGNQPELVYYCMGEPKRPGSIYWPRKPTSTHYQVICGNCSMVSCMYKKIRDAIKNWNIGKRGCL